MKTEKNLDVDSLYLTKKKKKEKGAGKFSN